ncbi:hypothetical protein GJ496_006607 [Pomphorhynchus laevis]|nr:hypothetical protein GJ496_006607 [Pomphorhynchus laevis]
MQEEHHGDDAFRFNDFSLQQNYKTDDMYKVVIQWIRLIMDLSRCNASNFFIDILFSFYKKTTNDEIRSTSNELKMVTIFSRCIFQRIPCPLISAIGTDEFLDKTISERISKDVILVKRLREHDASLMLCDSYQSKICSKISHVRINAFAERLSQAKFNLSNKIKCSLDFACANGASTELSAMPTEHNNYGLTSSEFRDGLATRYLWDHSDIPARCICNDVINLYHLQQCKQDFTLDNDQQEEVLQLYPSPAYL